MSMRKKGMSPIIATILLVALVVIIGLIIFVWFRSMTQESITKFDGTNVQLVCGDVNFKADYSAEGILYITNLGNVPIYNLDVLMEGAGSHSTEDIASMTANNDDKWPANGLNQGGVFSAVKNFSNYQKIVLIPILMGVNEDGIRKTSVCEERHGVEIYLN